MNVIREINQLNDRELSLNVPLSGSWHSPYLESATNQYIFVSGLDSELNEGDVIVVFSQCGEIVDCNLVRDRVTGRSRGFAFIAFFNPLAAILAIDNFNGARLLDRTLRVDHADKYRRPKSEAERELQKRRHVSEDERVEFELIEDAQYEARKKIVWDYDKYGKGTNAVDWNNLNQGHERHATANKDNAKTFGATELTAGALAASAAEDDRVARIMKMMEDRKRKREQQDKEAMKELDIFRGKDGKMKQLEKLQEIEREHRAHAEAPGDQKSAREKDSAKQERQEKEDKKKHKKKSHKRSRSRSRSRSRDRHRRHRRSRSRSRH